jgi:F420-dependent oxidoreductase-like protein
MARLDRREFLKSVGAVAAATALATRVSPGRAHAAAKREKLRFGVQTHPQHTRWADILPVWEDADGLGLDTAFVFDHFIPIRSDTNGPCLEGWTLLSALLARTHRIHGGILVTGNTYRHPAVLAKMAATVDQLSDGRLILGMGAGWYELEHTAYGIPFYTAGQRARRLVESVEVVNRLFTEPRPTWTGKYYQLKEAPFEPKSVQRPRPPLLIGGMGPKVVQPLAARHADVWHFFAAEDVDETRRTIERFDDLVRQAGREPAAVEKAVSLRTPDVDGKSTKEVATRVRALADAGVGHFILSLAAPFDRPLLRRFAKEIVPAARAA